MRAYFFYLPLLSTMSAAPLTSEEYTSPPATIVMPLPPPAAAPTATATHDWKLAGIIGGSIVALLCLILLIVAMHGRGGASRAANAYTNMMTM